ncbi:MAG: cell wall-active antibiotics response protein [Paenibacillus sp.]|nr:cell wall-active antibiotics response protein [Paenibacillus sp.]
MNKRSSWLGGLVLIGIGLIFLLQQWGIIDFNFSIGELISTFWPLIVIYVGLSGLLQGGFWGIFPLGVGAYFLMSNLNVITMGFGEFIRMAAPAVLIVAGLWLLFRPKRNRRKQAGHMEDYLDQSSYPPKSGDDCTSTYNSNTMNADSGLEEDPLAKYENYPDPFKNVDYSNDKGPSFEEMEKQGGKFQAQHNKSSQNQGHKHKHHHKHHDDYDDDGSSSWHYDGKSINKSGFIGDFSIGQDYWELKPMNVSHFIGDTSIDLTKAQVPYGETKLNISAFIGDVKVYVPNDVDLGVAVTSSSFIGDVKVFGQNLEGFMRNVQTQTPNYHEANKKIRLVVSGFISDIKVVKVG